MSSKKINSLKIEEPATTYKSPSTQKGIGENFDFDKEFAKGLTVEEARALSKSKIREWWGK